jgi:hypothetical protein
MMVVVDLMEDSGMALLLLPDTAAVPDMAGHLLDVTGEEVALQAMAVAAAGVPAVVVRTGGVMHQDHVLVSRISIITTVVPVIWLWINSFTTSARGCLD